MDFSLRAPLDAHPLTATTAWKVRVFLLSALGIGAVGIVDHVTGVELRVYPLYFPSIAYGAWSLSRRASMVLAVIAAAVWLMANLLEDSGYTTTAIWAVNGLVQLLAFVLVAFLISELRRRLRYERQLSRTDSLTGLSNSRAFHEDTRLLLAAARRHRLPVTLAYLDLDDFKLVNDRHGHEVGDQALSAAASVLRSHCRASDLVSRLGGDEFALLLFGADCEKAETVLERLRLAVSDAMRDQGWPITTTIGAVAFVDAPPDLSTALTTADALMYRAKRAGKDRVTVERAVPPA